MKEKQKKEAKEKEEALKEATRMEAARKEEEARSKTLSVHAAPMEARPALAQVPPMHYGAPAPVQYQQPAYQASPPPVPAPAPPVSSWQQPPQQQY
ncbi:hypothetical protein CORC01_10906 [Colletotrichum orchidophilum]|uniref:Uncharacterized protein n=1 Tax=Colletotrichum orchidophilum TaxID=1209926 RepID=A0A1G4AX93_9PEZI|nr:uncharacterized protein CORC01_10906 [Colletotrichum orchidophilum]OHE93780.1 hypothetical protein CORC01_10906 [Colletotrichum orchidophilum]